MATKKPAGKIPQNKLGRDFVGLGKPMLRSLAWRSLTGSAVRYYLELRSRYNGFNNGDLSVSLGEAETLLSMGRHTVVRAQQELQEKGFIKLSKRGGYYQHLANTWSLTDCRTPRKQATNDWKYWEPKKIPQCRNGTEVVPRRHRGNGSTKPRGAVTAPRDADSTPSSSSITAPPIDIPGPGVRTEEGREGSSKQEEV